MEEQAADYDRAIAIILAGGVGSRLQPLTDHRTKPAVPFGGKFRIIDFTLSNCLHSRLRKDPRPHPIQIAFIAEASAGWVVDF